MSYAGDRAPARLHAKSSAEAEDLKRTERPAD